PKGHGLVADRLSCSITYVDWQSRQFVSSCGLNDTAFPVILTLLERWPSYVPYEMLFPLLDGELKDQEVEERELAELAEKCADLRAASSQRDETVQQQASLDLQSILLPLRTLFEESLDCLKTVG